MENGLKMRRSGARFVLAGIACVLCAGSAASARWVTSITRPVFSTGPTTVYKVDDTSGESTAIFDPLGPMTTLPATAPGFTGLAADEANTRLFATTTNGTKSDLYVLSYSDPANVTATLLTGLTRPMSTTGMVVDGLAYDTMRSVLYATRTLGGAGQNEGLYTVNPATGETVLVLEYEPTSTSNYQIGGIDYDPVADRIYLADDDDTGGRNIYYVDGANPAAGLQLLMAYPTEVTDVDGLGANNGRLFLLSDSQDDPDSATVQGNGGLHYLIDVATMSVAGTFTSPYPLRTISSIGSIDPTGGAAWAPGLFEPDCPADLTGDGVADLADLVAFLSEWQPIIGSPANGSFADLVEDGFIDLADLVAFLEDWLPGC